MALVNIETALNDALRLIRKSPLNGGIEILSYKRNRTVALIRIKPDIITIQERGYRDEETTVDLGELAKKLKPILKREFPQSRKVRFFKFTDPEELLRIHQKI